MFTARLSVFVTNPLGGEQDAIINPKSHIYLVYNENRDTSPGSDDVKDRLFMVKMTYFWNI